MSRYTHRMTISNSRWLALDGRGVTFRWKVYQAKGSTRYETMTLPFEKFMRRFPRHVLPGGFHRIRHCGLLANGGRKVNPALARELLGAPKPEPAPDDAKDVDFKTPTSSASTLAARCPPCRPSPAAGPHAHRRRPRHELHR